MDGSTELLNTPAAQGSTEQGTDGLRVLIQVLSLEDVLGRHTQDAGTDMTSVPEDETGVIETIVISGVDPANIETVEQFAEDFVLQAVDSSMAAELELAASEMTVATFKAGDIDTVYAQGFTLTDGIQTSSPSNYLLLKNGWAFVDLKSSPLALTNGPLEQTTGDGWAPWRSQDDGVHEILDATTGMWKPLHGTKVDTSPKTPEDVAGAFVAHFTEKQFMWTRTGTTTLQLTNEGIFAKTTSSFTTSTTVLPDISYMLRSNRTAVAQNSLFSGVSVSDDIQSATLGSYKHLAHLAGDMFGSFKMLDDGMTLELQFADGSIEQQLLLKTVDQRLNMDGRSHVSNGHDSVKLLNDLMKLLDNSGDSEHRSKWLKTIADVLRKDTGKEVQREPAPGLIDQNERPEEAAVKS